VSLTDDGRRLVDQLLPKIVKTISTSFAGVDREEIETVSKVLHQIEQNPARMAGEAPTGD
jgi:DNA-binding MarR family transcriptional regulator